MNLFAVSSGNTVQPVWGNTKYVLCWYLGNIYNLPFQ